MSKDGLSRKEKIRLWVSITPFVLLIIYFFVYDPIMEHKYLSKDVRYTISTHHSTSHTTRGPYYNYRFEYKGRIYYGSTSITLDTIFIKFSTIDPNYNEATYIKATEEDIKNMPKGGYIKLPHD